MSPEKEEALEKLTELISLLNKIEADVKVLTDAYNRHEDWLQAQPEYDPMVYHGYDAMEVSRMMIAKLQGRTALDGVT